MSKEELKPNSDFLMSEFKEALSEKGVAFTGENRYSEEEYLSEGGCKKLFVLTDLWTEREVVKALPKDDSPENIERFIYESQLLASLEHPNILPVYDVGSDDGKPYILMKLMEGDNLRDFLSYDPPLSLKLKIFEKICDAVSYCHKNEIVHLDLKPENVQISPYLEVTVCDWGSARRFADLRDSSIASTPGYVAPEVFDGSLSAGSDIYSLGVLLYEILVQERLFKGKNAAAILKKNKDGKVNLNRIKDPSLKAICKKALAVNPEERYEEVQNFLDSLNLYYQKIPLPEEKAGFTRKIDLLIKRRPMVIGMTTVFFTMTSIIALIFALSFNKQKNEAEMLMTQYQTERDKRISLSQENSALLHDQAWKAYKAGMLDEALDLLNFSTSTSGYTEKKYELEGLISLLKFDPQRSKTALEKAGVADNYKDYFSLIPEKSDLLKMSIKKLAELITKIRKVDSYYYHYFIGSIFTLPEFDDTKKEQFINAVTRSIGFHGKVSVRDRGMTLAVSGNGQSFPTYILRAMRIKKLDFRGCKNMPSDIRTKEINDCVELEELDLRNTDFKYLYLLKNNNIKKLYLPSKHFSRIEHLQSMPLEELYLVDVNVKTFKPLLQIKTLKSVTVSSAMTKLPHFRELADKITVHIIKK
ncbi:MAG: serine/threonine protein kinase [Lentisphaeraceae bacterium]|nr:serine/threonine protein kinase [Lentisphaeraceae bacterium]